MATLLLSLVLPLLAVVLPIAWLCYDYLRSQPRISSTDSTGQRRLVLITGCDSGFGQALTRSLDRQGYRVLASCLTPQGQRDLTCICSDRVLPFSLDLTKPASIEAVKALVDAQGGRLHSLVLNSGVAVTHLVDFQSIDAFQLTMQINFLGHVHLTKLLLPSLLPPPHSAWSERRGGRLVVMTSAAGILSGPGMSAYAASKHALEAFADSMRREMGPLTAWRLSVSLIEPSFMATPMVANSLSDDRLNDWDQATVEVQQRWGRETWEHRHRVNKSRVGSSIGDPAVVVDAYLHAITAEVPRTRYHPGLGSMVLWWISHLPVSWVDRVFSLPTTPTPTYFTQRSQTSK